MARVRSKQLDELQGRHRLPSTDPRHISREFLQAFLDGRLMPPSGFGRRGEVQDLRPMVKAMVEAGYPAACGMKPQDYVKLWPRIVWMPVEYGGIFNKVLLVDRSIAMADLVRCGNINRQNEEDPVACTDLNPCDAPRHPSTNAPLTRYVAFCQLGGAYCDCTPDYCDALFARREDEVGLVTVEGLHIPLQYGDEGEQVVVLVGSRCSALNDNEGKLARVPVVTLFSENRKFGTVSAEKSHQGCGSASRGRQVIPVSW